jgi:hypothetical protein
MNYFIFFNIWKWDMQQWGAPTTSCGISALSAAAIISLSVVLSADDIKQPSKHSVTLVYPVRHWLRASLASWRIWSARVRSGPTGPPDYCGAPQRCDVSESTRPARPILGPYLDQVCASPNSPHVLPWPPRALSPAAENELANDAARCVDVNHRPVGNPKRKVWWAQQQTFPSVKNQGLSNPRKSQTPEGDAC